MAILCECFSKFAAEKVNLTSLRLLRCSGTSTPFPNEKLRRYRLLNGYLSFVF